MKKILCIMIVLTALFSAATVASARTARGAVASGNRLYMEKKFEGALKDYSEAAEKLPDSDVVNFDIGTALYKNKSFKEAEEAFNKALASGKTNLEAKANYNIGNTKYRQGQAKEKTDVRSTIELYKAALDHYQRAIELDEKDEDAKFNYEFVKKKLEELLKNEPPQSREEKKQDSSKKEDKKQESGGSGSKGGGEQEKEKKDQEKQEQERQEQEKQEQEKREQEKQEQEQEQEKQEREKQEQERRERERQGEQEEKQTPQSQEGPQPSQSPEEEEGRMSDEEAGMLLEGQKQEEESQGELRFRRKMLPYPDVVKDW